MESCNDKSRSNKMKRYINRRNVLGLAGASILGGALTPGESWGAAQASSAAISRGDDNFSRISRASTGAMSASFSDYAVQSPEGQTCSARLTYPLIITKKLPVLIFCPDEGARASQYDLLTAALAAQNYFILTIDRRSMNGSAAQSFMTPDQRNDHNLRRVAEARFMLDTIDAAAAVLGTNAQMVDGSRVGAIGHGDGAWIAAGLGGWDSSGAANTRTRDGRIYAIFGLAPSVVGATNRVVPAQRSPDGVSGMFAGVLAQMPLPARDSGILGLGLPIQSNSFGGLIGQISPTEARRLTAEPDALAAAIASAVLFFDWTLRGDSGRKKELFALDGRFVTGLSAPLTLKKA